MVQTERPLSSRMVEWSIATSLVWMTVKSAMEVDRLCPYGRIDAGRTNDWYNGHARTWREELRPELFAGSLVATAVKWKGTVKCGEAEVISPSIWRDANLAYDHDDRWFDMYVDVPAALKERGEGSFQLREIRIKRSDVQLCFPSQPQQSRPYSHLAASHLLSLVDVKDWIICRGQTIPYEVYEEREAAAEREMFDKIDAAQKSPEGLKVYGIEEDAPDRQQAELPVGIWERMNRAPGRPPSFTELTFDACHGPDEPSVSRSGTIHLKNETYLFVKIPTSFVLKTWPPSNEDAPFFAENAPSSNVFPEHVNAGKDEYEKCERLLQEYIDRKERITRDQFVTLAESIASSTVSREVFKEKKPSEWKSGPRGPRKR